MTKRSLTILMVALVLIAGATIAIASSIGGSDSEHTMPGGGTMSGETMSGTHRMPSGESMEGMSH